MFNKELVTYHPSIDSIMSSFVVNVFQNNQKLVKFLKKKSNDFFPLDSNSKKSCQGCELPSDDIPDSTSNSRGHNNNTPSATNNNNNNQPNSSTNCSNSNGSAGVVNSTNSTGLTPNSTIEMGASPALNTSSSNVISADSSVASSGSLEEEEEVAPTKKIKKKDDSHVSD